MGSTSLGAFSIAWATGYVAVFAPSGIGVREAVLVALLAPSVPAEEAVAYAAVSRVIWTLVEFVLGLLAFMFLREGETKAVATAEEPQRNRRGKRRRPSTRRPRTICLPQALSSMAPSRPLKKSFGPPDETQVNATILP